MTVTLRKTNNYPKIFKTERFLKVLPPKQITILTGLDSVQPYISEAVKTPIKLMAPHHHHATTTGKRHPTLPPPSAHLSTETPAALDILYKPTVNSYSALKRGGGGEKRSPNFK